MAQGSVLWVICAILVHLSVGKNAKIYLTVRGHPRARLVQHVIFEKIRIKLRFVELSWDLNGNCLSCLKKINQRT